MRTISDIEIRSLKGATDAAFILGGGVTRLPLMTRVNVSTLSKYASFNVEHNEKLIPVDVAIEADRHAKSPVIVSAMAEVLGYRLERCEARISEHKALSTADANALLKEAHDVWGLLIEAFEDGRIDALEKKILRRGLRELIRAAEQLLDRLEEED